MFRLAVRACPFIRPYRRHLVYLLLLTLPTLLGGLFALSIVRVFLDVIGHGDALTAGEAWMLRVPLHADRRTVLFHGCAVVGIAATIAMPMIAVIFGYAVWILQRISNLFRVNLYTRLQELSVQFHSQEKIGDAIFRMFQDSAAIPQVINGLIIQPLIIIPAAIGALIYLAMYDYRMALIASILIPANFILAWIFGGALRRAFIGERALHGLAYVSALYIGALEVLAGGTAGLAHAAVSLGLFQGSLVILGAVSRRMRHLTDLWGSMQDVVVAISRVLEMLGKTPEQSVSSGQKIPPNAAEVLSFETVSFGYDPRTPVLAELSFTARIGEITAIAGASGSGKSTIIALIVRFFDPVAGSIRLDGKEIREFDLAAWRGMLSVALQENPLFTATLADNVAYGRPDASRREVMRAVELAGLGAFVRALPAGMATMLGEKGAKLSTGQAQRIGLARALLRNSPILLLDEPTAALDGATEDSVMRGLREWVNDDPKRRMAIIATHRKTTASHADRIYQLVSGRLVSAGDTAFEVPRVREVKIA